MSKYAYELNLPDYYIKTKGADGMTVTVEGKEAYDFFIKAVTAEKVREARLRGRVDECHYVREYLNIDVNNPANARYLSKRLYDLEGLINDR